MTPNRWQATLSMGNYCTALEPVSQVRIELVMTLGSDIRACANAAWLTSLHTGLPVSFEFNGHRLTAYPGQPSAEVVALYWSNISDEPLPDAEAPGATQATEPPPATEPGK